VVAGCEGIESSQRAGKIQAQVACEVVERTRGHHHERQVALHGHPRHRRHRPIAAGHGERFHAVLRCLEGGVHRVLPGLQHAHPDPAFASCPGQALR